MHPVFADIYTNMFTSKLSMTALRKFCGIYDYSKIHDTRWTNWIRCFAPCSVFVNRFGILHDTDWIIFENLSTFGFPTERAFNCQ